MEEKKIKINLSTFILITLIIIILIIGIILLIVKNRSKQENTNLTNDVSEIKNNETLKKEYSIKILNYLKNKYGSDTEFEIKDINSEDKEIIGDGYAMGTDKTPVVISSYTLVVANVLSKENNITFIVSFKIDKMLGEENSFHDDLEDLLIKEDIPKI